MVLELVNREEALILGDVKLLIGEEPVVVLGGHLSKRPDKGHVFVLDVVIGSRITYVVWSRVCVCVCVCVCDHECVLLSMIACHVNTVIMFEFQKK